MRSAVFFTAIFAAAVLAGIWLWHRRARSARAERLAFAMLPAAGACLGALFFHKIYSSIFFNLNWVRLHKTFVAALGHKLYYGPGEGPALLTLYPPASTLAYLPVTWFASPFSAMRAAESLNLLFFFLPIAVLHFACRPQEERFRLYACMAFLVFASFPFLIASLRSAAFHIHADASALGLSAAACAALLCPRNKSGDRAFFFSALFAVLAVWSKQVAAPILLALPVYVLSAHGARCLLRYLLWTVLLGAVVSAFFIDLYGFKELAFQTIVIPASQGFGGKEGLPPFAYALLKLLTESSLILLVALPAIRPLLALRKPSERLSSWLRGNPWALLLLVAIFMVPTSLLGRAKIGSSANTLSYSTYFLAAAATLSLLKACSTSSARRSLVALTAIFCAVFVPALYVKFLRPDHGNVHFARTAYEHLEAQPGRTFFPRLLLLHLLAEGKVYHDEFALMDREWAGMPVEGDRLAAHLPSGIRQIAYLKSHEGNAGELTFPAFSLIEEDPDLPGFYVRRIPDGAETRA